MHENTFRAIIRNYNLNRLWKSRPFLFSILVTISIGLFAKPITDKDAATKFLEISFEVLPSLIGFSLAGLAIIIAFTDTKAIVKIDEYKIKREKPETTIYLKTITVFTWAVLVQSIALVVQLCLGYLFSLKPEIISINTDVVYERRISMAILLILCFLNSYSIFLVPYIVKNIYGFGQFIHLSVITRKNSSISEEH